MDNPQILITGGTGFAGSHLVEHLLEQGYKNIHVTAYSDKSGFVHDLLPAAQIHKLNLTDATATADLIKELQPDQLYHLAALSTVGDSFSNASQVCINNFQLQVNVLEAIKQHSPQTKILAIGSAQEYDVISHQADSISEDHQLGPANPYGVSKVDQDLLALSYHYAYDLKVIRVRPFNHIGEGQTRGFAVPDFAFQIAEIETDQREKISVGNLDAIRDFTDVKDIVRGYVTIMEKGELGQVYNLGSGSGISIQSILDQLSTLADKPITVEVDPKKFRPLDVPQIIADTTRIKELEWYPEIPINSTLQRVLNYWRKQI
jgi:GDP-4-dehydro-6-deoxy-D-mannose reductase